MFCEALIQCAVTLSLNCMCFLTSATGRAALCAPTLCPRVGGLWVRVHAGVRGNLVRVGFLFDDVIAGDVTLVGLLTWVGWAYCLNYKKVEGCSVEFKFDK